MIKVKRFEMRVCVCVWVCVCFKLSVFENEGAFIKICVFVNKIDVFFKRDAKIK